MCVWAISPSLLMERRQKHQAPEAEKSRPVMYCSVCNNILKVVFLVKVFESGTWGGQPRRAFTVQMVTALWWFCFWGAKMETFGIGVSHTYRSQDGQSLMTLQKTHTHIQFVCVNTHSLKHTEDTYCIYITHLLVPYPVSCSGHKHPVHKGVLKECSLVNTRCTQRHFFFLYVFIICFCGLSHNFYGEGKN